MKSTPLASLLCGALALSSAQKAGAALNLVQNGGFESVSPNPPGDGQLSYNVSADHWSSSGYNILFNSGTATTTGAPSFNGNVTLQGLVPASSPDGGNFVASDAADDVGPIQQTITGLQAGHQYLLSFYWAGAEEVPNHLTTTEQWTVSLGAQTQTTSLLIVPAGGFSGWKQVFFSYTATSSSEVLKFLASGTPVGGPPFALLDGVSLVGAVPEPSTVTAGAAALLLLVGAGARRSFGRKTRV